MPAYSARFRLCAAISGTASGASPHRFDDASATERQTELASVSAVHVCQPGPVAFQRASVSRGSRSELLARTFPVFGRPRGFSMLAADAAQMISGSTSHALRARSKVAAVQASFSRSVRNAPVWGARSMVQGARAPSRNLSYC